jgi:hypothetical protein
MQRDKRFMLSQRRDERWRHPRPVQGKRSLTGLGLQLRQTPLIFLVSYHERNWPKIM